jgi:hypothetical protein
MTIRPEFPSLNGAETPSRMDSAMRFLAARRLLKADPPAIWQEELGLAKNPQVSNPQLSRPGIESLLLSEHPALLAATIAELSAKSIELTV